MILLYFTGILACTLFRGLNPRSAGARRLAGIGILVLLVALFWRHHWLYAVGGWVFMLLADMALIFFWLPRSKERDQIPQQPTPIPADQVADIIKAQSMQSLGIKEHQISSPILQELRVPPGDLEDFLDDLEARYGFFVSPDDRSKMQSISDLIRVVQNTKN